MIDIHVWYLLRALVTRVGGGTWEVDKGGVDESKVIEATQKLFKTYSTKYCRGRFVSELLPSGPTTPAVVAAKEVELETMETSAVDSYFIVDPTNDLRLFLCL